MNQLAQADFVRRVLLRGNERFLAADVIHVGEDEPCLDTRHIECKHSGGMNVEASAGIRQSVPDFDGVLPGNPDLIAEVAGVARARDVDRYTADLAARFAEIFQVLDVGFGDAFEQFARCRTLQGQRRELLGDVFDLNLKSDGILTKPAQIGVGGSPAIGVFSQSCNGAVVNDLAVFIAPAAIDDLIDGDFVDIAGQYAIDKASRITTCYEVLEQGRDVDQSRRIADGVVFVFVVRLVHADGVKAGPLAIIQAGAEGKRSFVNGGTDGHLDSSWWLISADYSGARARAARTPIRLVLQTNS